MRFLVEQYLIEKNNDISSFSELPEDVVITFNSLSDNQKLKYAMKIAKNYSKTHSLAYAEPILARSIAENGIEIADNPFLAYIDRVTRNGGVAKRLSTEVATYIDYFLNNGDISAKSKWLYNTNFYAESDKDVIYKLKAFVYATNRKYQQNANRQITPELFQDKNGHTLSAADIKKVMSRITITQGEELTIQNALNKKYGYKDINNPNNEKQIKDFCKKLIRSSKNYTQDMETQIDKLSMKDLVRIPINAVTTNSVAVGLTNFLQGKTTLVDTTKSGKRKQGLDFQQLAKRFNKSEQDVKTIVDDAAEKMKADLVSGLINLGFGQKDATRRVEAVYREGASFEDLFRECLIDGTSDN